MTGAAPTRLAAARLPTEHGVFEAIGFRDADGETHVALVAGDVAAAGGDAVLVRLHSECLTGDVLGSRRCDCGPQLHEAMRLVAAAGRGVIVYLRGHEGRGIGIGPKLQAYALQDAGFDTVDANLELGWPVDLREYGIGAEILLALGVRHVRLLTNNPAKRDALDRCGVVVDEVVPLRTPVHADNEAYLRAKRDRLHHFL